MTLILTVHSVPLSHAPKIVQWETRETRCCIYNSMIKTQTNRKLPAATLCAWAVKHTCGGWGAPLQ